MKKMIVMVVRYLGIATHCLIISAILSLLTRFSIPFFSILDPIHVELPLLAKHIKIYSFSFYFF